MKSETKETNVRITKIRLDQTGITQVKEKSKTNFFS